MHIAVALYGLTAGGAARRVLTLVEGFVRSGHRVDVLVIDADAPLTGAVATQARLVLLGCEWPLLPLRPRRRRRRIRASIPHLARWLERERPDVLLSGANHMHLASALACRIARVRVPLVLRASNHLTASHRRWRERPRLWLARRCYASAEAIVAVTEAVADDLVRTTRVEASHVVTIPNPTFTADIEARAAERVDHPWLADRDIPVILGVGRLAPSKDFPMLMRAFAQVCAVRPARLVILGEGKERAALGALADTLGISSDVALPGFVVNSLAWMSRAAMLVSSSAWEGAPAVLIEALAAGCPVVSTDCPGGSAEILGRGAFGKLVPVGDADAMASAILATLDARPDPALLRARAAAFASEGVADRYAAVLADASSRFDAPPRIQIPKAD